MRLLGVLGQESQTAGLIFKTEFILQYIPEPELSRLIRRAKRVAFSV
jgi:hypothetical protein